MNILFILLLVWFMVGVWTWFNTFMNGEDLSTLGKILVGPGWIMIGVVYVLARLVYYLCQATIR